MMKSKYRQAELEDGKGSALPYDTALFLIRDSVARRRSLIYGRLEAHGKYCAIGAFFHDNPNAELATALIDEVAAVNDSVPRSATPKERWKKVNEWLRFKTACLARTSTGGT
jgi:hypothetical protein